MQKWEYGYLMLNVTGLFGMGKGTHFIQTGYGTRKIGGESLEEGIRALNELTKDNWEVVNYQANMSPPVVSYHYLLKRPIKELDNENSDDLEHTIEEIARDIANIEPDPQDWEWWIGYFVGKLGDASLERGNFNSFEQMKNSLKDNI